MFLDSHSTFTAQGLTYKDLQYSTDGELTQFSTNAPTNLQGSSFVSTVQYQYDVRGEQTFIGGSSPLAFGLVTGGGRYAYGAQCTASPSPVAGAAMPTNPAPALSYSGNTCVGQNVDPYTGVSGYAGVSQYSDSCPNSLSWSYDNDGRQSSQYALPKAKSGCSHVRSLFAGRTYDAENHMLKTSSYASDGSVTTYESLA